MTGEIGASVPQTTTQEVVDRFYWSRGPCCAGCDWWRHFNALIGECLRSPPVGEGERGALIGVQGSSLIYGAGHVVTPRDHRCGDFKDEFDWRSLSPSYLRRIETALREITRPKG